MRRAWEFRLSLWCPNSRGGLEGPSFAERAGLWPLWIPFTCGIGSEYAHSMRWIGVLCLVILAAAVPACGEHRGHRGLRDDHAVSAAMKLKTRETIYRHTLSERYAGYT